MKKIFWNKDFIQIIASAILFISSFLVSSHTPLYFILIGTSYLIVSYKMFIEAFENLIHLELFDENTLMILATIGAFWIGEYPEAVMVILLFQLGEYLSNLAVSHSKEKVLKLMDLRSDTATRLLGNQEQTVPAKDIKIGELLIIRPGEKIPIDGEIVKGTAYLDTSSLTGESVLQKRGPKDTVLSGMVCTDQILTIRTTKLLETSTANKILSLIENSNEKKANTEKFITKFSKIYTPIVVLLAVLIALLPLIYGEDFQHSFYTALVFLVMSCPCALVLSVPLAFFCGIGRASKDGILIKGANELEQISTIDTLLLDKTGTVTKGVFEITQIITNHCTKEELLEIAAYGEFYSNHPIAKSIQKDYHKKIDTKRIEDFREIRGKGIQVTLDKKTILLGNAKLLREKGISFQEQETPETIVYIAQNKKYLGAVLISDVLRENISETIKNLHTLGIKQTIIVSGDQESIVQNVANQIGVNQYYASLLPEEKVKIVNEYKKDNVTAFVGDGMNDAPVIQRADIGIAMGGIGSDATIEASDVVIMRDDISKLIDMIKISKLTKKLVIINITFALFIKGLVLILGLFGITTIALAVFADVGVTLLCVLNTFQILKRKLR